VASSSSYASDGGRSWLSASDGSSCLRRRSAGSPPCRRAPCDGARGGPRRRGGVSDCDCESSSSLPLPSSLPSLRLPSSSLPLAALLSSRLLRRLGPELAGAAARAGAATPVPDALALPVSVVPVPYDELKSLLLLLACHEKSLRNASLSVSVVASA